MHLNLEQAEEPVGEKLGEDVLNYADIDTDTRKEMLHRQNKVLVGLVKFGVLALIAVAAIYFLSQGGAF